MHAIRFLAVLLLASLPTQGFTQETCSRVLDAGAFATTEIRNNEAARLVIAAEMSKLTFSEAQAKYGAGISVPIKGIPIGADYNQEQYDKWVEEVRNTIDVDQILTHSSEVLISSGDPVIVRGWVECMINKKGIIIWGEPHGKNKATIYVQYIRPEGVDRTPVIVSGNVVGAQITAGEEYTRRRTRLGSSRQVVTLERTGTEDILFALNTDLGGGIAFLPYPKELPEVPAATDKSLELCSCGASGGGMVDFRGWAPKGEPCWGINGWGFHDQNCKVVTTVARCTGKELALTGLSIWGPPGEICAGRENWGRYEATPVRLTDKRFCSCTGPKHPNPQIQNGVEGITAYAPEGEACYGLSAPLWGTHAAACR